MQTKDLEDVCKYIVVGEDAFAGGRSVLLECNLNLDEHFMNALNLLQCDDRVGAVGDVAVYLNPVLNVSCVSQLS